MADTANAVIVRTYISLASGERLFVTEPYQDVLDRVVAARDSHQIMNEEGIGNPLSLPLVNVRMIVRTSEEDDEPIVVDACFNPMHLIVMYRAHPDA